MRACVCVCVTALEAARVCLSFAERGWSLVVHCMRPLSWERLQRPLVRPALWFQASSSHLCGSQDELQRYDPALLAKPAIIVANKADACTPDDARTALHALKAVTQLPIVPVSALQAAGLVRLQQALRSLAPLRLAAGTDPDDSCEAVEDGTSVVAQRWWPR